jgi:hypothetical protein
MHEIVQGVVVPVLAVASVFVAPGEPSLVFDLVLAFELVDYGAASAFAVVVEVVAGLLDVDVRTVEMNVMIIVEDSIVIFVYPFVNSGLYWSHELESLHGYTVPDL